RYSQVAIQGPKAFALLEKIFGKDLREDIPRFWFNQCFFEGAPVLVARTGYTGEDGVEVWIPPSGVEVFWDAVLEAGEEFGVLPCGLGARDTLRLEAAYPLHGHELGPEISAIESGLRWIVKLKQKGEFIGRAIIEEQITNGAPRALVGFFVRDPGIVREGSEVQSEDGKTVGTVTSGTQTPTVGRALGLALVDRSFSQKGAVLKAVVRGKPVSIEVTSTPFYRGEGV
ncbi:MAG: hypothetical protein KDD60_06825, partial [Bdellovibrionales bacterium]|nr:hypothetical protein [Bdellovibrionales bacterium]